MVSGLCLQYGAEKVLTCLIQEYCGTNLRGGTWQLLASFWNLPALVTWQGLQGQLQWLHKYHDLPNRSWKTKLPWCGTTVAALSCWAATKYWQTSSGPYPSWVLISRWTWLQWCEHLSSPLWVILPNEVLQVYSQVALVGEITYNSVVTRREEPVPIGVSVIGAPGV